MKHLLLITFLFSILFATSQYIEIPDNQHVCKEAPNHHSVRGTSSHYNTNRSTIAQWINFIDATASYYSSTPDYDYYYLFPDTTVFAQYSTSLGIPFIHSFGMTYDLSSEVINSQVGSLLDEFDISQNAFIDTIATYGRYIKGSAGHTDTLIFRVVPRGSSNLNRVGYFTNQLTKYPSSNDTARYRRLYWDSISRKPFGVIAEYKVPLLLSDTIANGLIYPKAIAGGLAVPSIFAVTIDFKPGGSYMSGDTMGERIGSYTQVVAEHNGNDTYHNYIPGDYTGSGKVHRSVRYNYSTTGWNGRYIPFLAYGSSEFEAIDIDLFIRQTNSIGIDEFESGVKLFQNYPNPSNGLTRIKYELANSAEVSFEIIDVTGKKVMSIIEGNRNSGINTIDVNTSELKAGIYFYSIVIDGNAITKKMIVTK
ncbi:MAG: T9SS type A sorting domain-containing protein [Flavobacteriales bacterium]